MARQPRIDIAGEIYHVINRSNARWKIFKSPKNFNAVIQSLVETLEEYPIDIFSFCIMSNHWHFAVRPKENGDMGQFFGKFTQKVTQRWHAAHKTTGSGHLFQGRFKSFLVEQDSYFLQLMKYIEANALRAKLVGKAEDWQWGSLYIRLHNQDLSNAILKAWPVDLPKDYLKQVNDPLPKAELDHIRYSVIRSRPLGGLEWVNQVIKKYNLEHTERSPGRPRK